MGAVIGFALAQSVNLVSLVWSWWKRPRLVIEELPQNRILSHNTQLPSGEEVGEQYYAFVVRNRGRRTATGVRFQILKIMFRGKDELEFGAFPDVALNLASYAGADGNRGSEEITLVPKGAATVGLACWREDHDTVLPLASDVFDYYEETTQGSHEFQFEVVAFDDCGDFVTKTISILPRVQTSVVQPGVC
jgi:hypothetical protein